MELAFHLSDNSLPVVTCRRVKLHPVRVNMREERLCKECFVPGKCHLTLLGQGAPFW